MVDIVLISHGELAQGVRHAAEMVFGATDHVKVVSLSPDTGPEDFRTNLDETIEDLDTPDQLIILADLWGGTPFNQAVLARDTHPDWIIVTGLSLPLFVEAYAMAMSSNSSCDIARHIVAEAHKSIRIVPEKVLTTPSVQEAPAQKPLASPSTTNGSGPELAWVRIDSRLLHGQVAMSWSKQIHPTRIVVVSDNVAHDELRRSLIIEAAPPGIKANVIPVHKLVEVCNDARFSGQRFLLLFENPHDVLRVVKAGVKIPLINIGSMAHSAGKTLLGSAVSVDQDDVTCLKNLRGEGCEFIVQKVPTDKDEGLWNLIAKTDFEV